MKELLSWNLYKLEGSLQTRNVSAAEVTEACLNQIERCEPKINALLALAGEKALSYSKKLDQAGPSKDKPLWGVPVILKDALSTKDLPTTAASKILDNFQPIYDAFVVEKLKEAGAIIIAKANMDEFAMGSSTENSAFKKTRNPWNLNKVPGGSSGGSAAAVSARECFASLGSDTGGSIRQPAAFCGCVGLKPTYGRVSRYGLFAFASSLDQIGPIAHSVLDCGLMLNVIAGFDPRDNTSSPLPVENYIKLMLQPIKDDPFKGIKLGVPKEFFGKGLSEETRMNCLQAIEVAKNLGAEIIDIELPSPNVATATYYIIAMAEASSNLARYDGVRYGRRAAGITDLQELYNRSRSEGFGQEVKRRIMLGSYVLSSGYYDAYFRKAAQTRRLILDQYKQALNKCDVICIPVAPSTAWDLGTHEQDPLQAYLMDAFTLPINLAGLPAISLPVGLGNTTGMPVGMQLVGAHFEESKLLHIAHILEMALPAIGEPLLDWD